MELPSNNAPLCNASDSEWKTIVKGRKKNTVRITKYILFHYLVHSCYYADC